MSGRKNGITGFGGYIPCRRLSRKAIADANSWFQPALKGKARGERSMAGWDEDSLTMAVEAARDCLGDKQNLPETLYFATTSPPFADRLNAGIIAGALNLPDETQALDVTSSQKAGAAALLTALKSTDAASLVVASDKRRTRAAADQEMRFGDGAAALSVGSTDVIARLLGFAGSTVDFIDHYRGSGEEFDYTWEERWIRDEGYEKQVPGVIRRALTRAGIEGKDVDRFILPCPWPRVAGKMAKLSGIDPEKTAGQLEDVLGDTGTAHPMVMLIHALEEATPGEKIVMAVFAGGVDVLVFETTEALQSYPARRGIRGSLAERRPENNYMKYLCFNDLVQLEKGMRAEKDNRTPLSVTYRKRDMLFGLVGGRCKICQTPQFPRSRKCVNPECAAVDSQEPMEFADQPARLLSWSADFLTYTPDPPQHYGMVTFDGGGRFMADITDVDQGTVDSGTPVRMVFRIKDFDRRRGFTRYFWKATPILETETQPAEKA